jgi:transcription initiation factor TFIIIB Brf1 subunit/transcription initiation factor TFIIB
MSDKLMNLIDSVNKYLKNRGLAPVAGVPQDVIGIYEGALRSVWQLRDKEQRDALAIELAKALQKFTGGKNIETAYQEFSKKLNNEEQANLQKQQAEASRKQREERMKDPNYIPTFDELMNS